MSFKSSLKATNTATGRPLSSPITFKSNLETSPISAIKNNRYQLKIHKTTFRISFPYENHFLYY